MGRQARQDHQPEPWAQHGHEILDATGWTLGSARFPADARRIVAAINAVQGIPTDALESWFVNVIGETPGALVAGGRPGAVFRLGASFRRPALERPAAWRSARGAVPEQHSRLPV